jgi:ankyrin repeat protein
VEAAATARWDALPLLIELGFPVNGSTGRSALHHAAADGNLELVRLLIEHGADVEAVDPIFNVKPVEWARFFSRAEVVDYLTSAR